MIRTIILAGAVAGILATPALADPIEGNWKTESGETAAISTCGGSFCITLKTGKHAGMKIGQMSANGGQEYSGKVTDPGNGKTYKGDAKLNGNSMRMRGCVGFCTPITSRSETWKRQ